MPTWMSSSQKKIYGVVGNDSVERIGEYY